MWRHTHCICKYTYAHVCAPVYMHVLPTRRSSVLCIPPLETNVPRSQALWGAAGLVQLRLTLD